MIGKPVVLRVDDTLSVLEGRQVLLEENGYEVLTATGGKEVVQLFVSTRPVRSKRPTPSFPSQSP